jgi:hypothetical protein
LGNTLGSALGSTVAALPDEPTPERNRIGVSITFVDTGRVLECILFCLQTRSVLAPGSKAKSSMPIPPFDNSGALPPYIGDVRVAQGHSPYRVTVLELAERFSHSADRRLILEGFLRYRAALRAAGFSQGFQWLDGSFTEDIERIEGRSPNDIEVVTFSATVLPYTRETIRTLVSPEAKASFWCDGYLVDLSRGAHPSVRAATFWHALWSHRRDRHWKGMLEVDLSPDHDAAAAAILSAADGTAPATSPIAPAAESPPSEPVTVTE